MSGYGVVEARIKGDRKPRVETCSQCDDTGFVNTAYGLQECPLCREEDSHESE